jgi:hypothetical protein
VALWLDQLEVVAAPSTGPPTLGAWFSAPDQDIMRRAALLRRLPDRVVVIGYMGLRGTFEANRPQFLDVARTLGTTQCAR